MHLPGLEFSVLLPVKEHVDNHRCVVALCDLPLFYPLQENVVEELLIQTVVSLQVRFHNRPVLRYLRQLLVLLYLGGGCRLHG